MFHKFARAEILGAYGQRQRTANVKLADVNNYSDYKTDDGYLYVRVRAISSRVNKNSDGWPSEELEKSYRTFIGKPLFVDHNNHDPNRTRGIIVDAELHVDDVSKVSSNDPYYANAPDNHKPPTWVELLLEVDAKSFPRLAKAIIDQDIDGVSMGANVEYTKCSHCANRAETPDQFCSHILNKGALFDYKLPTGQKVSKASYEDCYKVSFFEISFVFDPADETALIRDIKQARTGSVRQAVLAESYNRHMLSDAFGDLSSSHEYLMQIGKEAWNQAILKEAPDPESNAWNAAMIAIKKAGFPQDAVEVANNIRESFTTMSDQLNAQVDPETQGYDETWIGHPEYGELHPTMQEMVLRTPSNREGDPRMSKTAENAAPQVDLVHMPEKVDTLRNETMCPLCGQNMDGGTCKTCFTPETPVRTIDGWVPIATVEVGDLVLSEDGDFHKVLEVQERDYHGFIQEIRTHGSFDPIRVTPEHTFKRVVGHHASWKTDECKPSQCNRSITGRDKWGNIITRHKLEWDEAKNLTTEHYVEQNYARVEHDLDVIEVPEKFRGAYRRGPTQFELTDEFLWAIGLYLAEGSSGNRSIHFTLHRDEVDVQERILNLFKSYGYAPHLALRKNCQAANISVHSSVLAEWFAEWLGSGCANKRIPAELFNLPTAKMDKIVQGIYDGDGNKAFHNGLGQTSYQLALQVNEYSMRAGGVPTTTISQAPNRKQEFTVTGVETALLNRTTMVQQQKKFTWKLHGINTVKVKSNSVTPYCGKVYNLTVEGDHTYTVQNILVHNCGYETPPEGLNNPDLTKANPDLHQNDAVELPQPDQQQQQPPPMNGMPSGGLPPNGQGQGGSMGNPMTSSFGVIYSAIGEMGGDEGYSMEEEPSENWQGLMQWVRNPESEYLLDDIVTHRAELNEVIDLLANFNIMPTPQNKQRFMQIAESAYGDIDPRDREQSDLVLPWGEEGNEYFRNAPPDLEDPRGGFGRQGKFGVIYIDNNLLTNEKRATGPNFQGGRVNTNEKPLLPLKRVVSDRPKNQKTVSDPPRPVVSKTDKETH